MSLGLYKRIVLFHCSCFSFLCSREKGVGCSSIFEDLFVQVHTGGAAVFIVIPVKGNLSGE